MVLKNNFHLRQIIFFSTTPLKHNENVPQTQNSTLKIINFAKQINARGLPVLLALVNKAYLPFVYSWLCNTMYMGIHRQVLFITTDSYSEKKITKDWPDVGAFTVLDLDELSGAQEYSKVGYVRLVVRRTEITLTLLKERIKLLLFEVDCLWFANPLSLCEKEAKGYDIVAASVSNRPGMVGFGFLYMLPTNTMIAFWELHTHSGCRSRTLAGSEADQPYLNRLIKAKYAGIKVNMLPLNLLADGWWYNLSDKEKKNIKPLIVNNNWVVGNKGKIQRAKRFGHWFWIEESGKCDTKLVNKTVY
ncbi:UDP-D-xylose:L-fucose alpha-1,3-D-xylosyltransferase 3-like [Gigantopelta aegis]|uniref:UDP-D-xylose:L-fucose alpha-1,3-D-xylosyltransferase 3-like n=1 Tax=Gigantopelta aegis TaxID=1735272 RepID=UPI001B88CA3A|nr:UDP-D-xylose:L-fucose alpha-1,3-D-xylosyltransferase 3-like [Gigantopelta aegis]